MTALTKDADKLLCLLYKAYLEARKAGISKGLAREFGGSDRIQERLLPNETLENVDETCRELSRSELVFVYYADDMAYRVVLKDAGIVYMENRFKNGLLGVVDFLSKFIP